VKKLGAAEARRSVHSSLKIYMSEGRPSNPKVRARREHCGLKVSKIYLSKAGHRGDFGELQKGRENAGYAYSKGAQSFMEPNINSSPSSTSWSLSSPAAGRRQRGMGDHWKVGVLEEEEGNDTLEHLAGCGVGDGVGVVLRSLVEGR
jgi:hypothetical protein